MDVTAATFDQDVIEASRQVPVLVDFWAPWCGPCRTLGPLLEKLEKEYEGRFRLAKVDSDQEQELAASFGVRSIPYVIGFRNGQPAAQFVGAQPESQVRAFIERLLPSPHETTLERAGQLIAEGRAEEAGKLLDTVPYDVDWEQRLEALRAAVGYARAAAGGEAELRQRLAANPGDQEARLALARLLAGQRRYREAMDELLDVVRNDKAARDEARKELLNVFTLLQGEPDLVSDYRRKLATALY